MLGKPEWFTYRLMGWGVMPRTWQGWVYLAAVVAGFGLLQLLPFSESVRVWLTGTFAGLVVLDVIHVMTQLSTVHDERERLHQLIVERNCSFAAVVTLVACAALQTCQNRAMTHPGLPFDPFILVVLAVMAVVKLASTIYVKAKM